MPWTMNDYPNSLKNLDPAVKKKAIEIANAMVDEGYEEGRAIPIATSQAKEWHENASKSEIDELLHDTDVEERDDSDDNDARPELMDQAAHVIKHDDGWAVKTEKAKRASYVKETKQEAIDRAEEIAKNKGTKLVIHKRDGSVQRTKNFS
ncbi:DUF2188 domain-containing protein [Bacillus gobiensis]|uniref:DUF2188 domain-containing protein n=1 Tax=Bacillus gobiensis TaxID=1441095 RepID=A0A0M4FUA4_9BACI|nr:DUF2188 domain-containing protein [Bacillus gobiensis]ALC83785.1 hypothetical protein AM592_21390 [Bacillus gobiensis]